MPELNEEYISQVLKRWKYLINENKLVIVTCDDGSYVVAEMWSEGESVNIFPVAKFLTEEEVSKLKLEGAEPRPPT